MDKVYVNYGCGIYAPKEWLNFDTSPTLRIRKFPLVGKMISKTFHNVPFPEWVKIGDIAKGLPMPQNSCDVMYCSHVLEHLSYEDLKNTLKNTFYHLKPGGVFRCLLPDLEILLNEYQDNIKAGKKDASVEFMRESLLGVEEKPKSMQRKLIGALGNFHHLWMWDFNSLAQELSNVGFINVKRCERGDTKDPMFDLIEDPTRFHKAMYLEAIKPAI